MGVYDNRGTILGFCYKGIPDPNAWESYDRKPADPTSEAPKSE